MPQPDPRTGRLQENSLPDLLQDLYSSRASGILALIRQGEKKSLFLNQGKIVYAMSNLGEDRLGNILVREGKLTQEQVEQALAAENKTQKKFGALVVEMRFLEPQDLFEGLKLQVREIVFSIFKWEEGSFRFEPGKLPKEIVPLSIDPAELVSEIIERLQKEDSATG
ncbi:MAG TPA: DUF4388 domain-containing protein [Nitrospiria bacterium]